MKILLVARWPVGGIKTYIKYIYGSPLFENVELTLLAPPEDLKDFIMNQLPPGRINLICTKTDWFAFTKDFIRCLRGNNFDIVHSHGFTASLFVQQILIFRNTPHIMTGHDVFLPGAFVGLVGKIKKAIMNWLLQSVNKVLSVSDDARNNMLQTFPTLNPQQVFNITNGIDTEFFKAGIKRDFHKELKLDKNIPLIGFFGRFMAQKGFIQIIQAMEKIVKDPAVTIKPIVLTFGWGGFIREDFSLIEKKGLTPYFLQLPGTDEMPAAIKGVDLVVMPSRWEACPLLPMEVLSAGVPIIGTSCIGLREVLNGTPAKIIPVGDGDALANAIVQQIDEGGQLFMTYQSEAVLRFSADMHVKKLYDVYMHFLSKNND